MTRRCRRCKKERDTRRFYPDRTHSSGRRTICRDCNRIERSLWVARLSGAKRERHEALRRRSDERRQVRRRHENAVATRDRFLTMQSVIDALVRKGWSYRRIGRSCGMNHNTISQYHRGRFGRYAHRRPAFAPPDHCPGLREGRRPERTPP